METSKYLDFIEIPNDLKKTKIYRVQNKNGNILGTILWEKGWRKYVYFSYENIIYDSKCLSDIISFIDKLMSDRKATT